MYKREFWVKYVEFKNQVENGERFSIYLFEGEDAFFRERGFSLIKSKFITEPELNCAYFEGDKLSEKEVVSSLTQYPFISPNRLTVIREYYPKKNGVGAGLLAVLNDMPPDSILVIVNEKTSDVLKGIKAVQLVECGKSDAITIARWIKGKCISAGVGVELETAKTLAEYCALDMNRVQNETEKLIAYCQDSKLVTTGDVEALVNRDVEYKIYELTDFIGKRQFDGALAVINDMLSKGETMQRLLISVYNYFRRLLHVAISSESDSQLATLLGVKEFAIKKTKAQAKQFSKRALKKAVDMLADTDYLIKSGAVDADNRIWLSIFSIMVEGV